MKILFVAPWIPAPIRPRSLAFLTMLAADHGVRFLGLVRHAEEARLADALPVADPVLVLNSRVGSMVRSLKALVTGESLQQGYASPRALKATLRRELTGWRPDVVHLNVFRTVHLVEACGDTPVIVDLDEFRSEYYDQLATTGGNLVWRTLGRVEAGRMRAREDELVTMGVPLMVSAPPVPGRERPNTYVVKSPYDFRLALPETLPVGGRRGGPLVLFVGRLSYEANVSGLLWFVRKCWAGIRRAVPDARLRVVGTDPPASVRALAGDGVEICADAPAVEPHYAAATAAIAPIFRGTGVQMKLIQSLAAGVPTVTTSEVAARAGVHDGVEVRVADDPGQWVTAVSTLLTGASAADLAANGRAWALANHSTPAVRRQLDTAYAAVTAAASDPAVVRQRQPARTMTRYRSGGDSAAPG